MQPLYLNHRSLALSTCALALVLMALALSLPPIAIFTARPADYLSVHILLEMFAISVSLMIVTIAWNTPDHDAEPIAQTLVFGFASVAGLDMLHTLYFAGMPGLVVERAASSRSSVSGVAQFGDATTRAPGGSVAIAAAADVRVVIRPDACGPDRCARR